MEERKPERTDSGGNCDGPVTPAIEAWGLETSPDAILSLRTESGAELGSCPYHGGPVADDILKHFRCRAGQDGEVMARLHDWTIDKHGERKFCFIKFKSVRIPGQLQPRYNAEPTPAPAAAAAPPAAPPPGPGPDVAPLLALFERRTEAAERRAEEAERRQVEMYERMNASMRELADSQARRDVEAAKERAERAEKAAQEERSRADQERQRQRELAEQQTRMVIAQYEAKAHPAAAPKPVSETVKETIALANELRELGGGKDHPILEEAVPRILQMVEMGVGMVIKDKLRKANEESTPPTPPHPPAAAPPGQAAPAATLRAKDARRPQGQATPAAPKNEQPKAPAPSGRKQVRGRVRGRR